MDSLGLPIGKPISNENSNKILCPCILKASILAHDQQKNTAGMNKNSILSDYLPLLKVRNPFQTILHIIVSLPTAR